MNKILRKALKRLRTVEAEEITLYIIWKESESAGGGRYILGIVTDESLAEDFARNYPGFEKSLVYIGEVKANNYKTLAINLQMANEIAAAAAAGWQ